MDSLWSTRQLVDSCRANDAAPMRRIFPFRVWCIAFVQKSVAQSCFRVWTARKFDPIFCRLQYWLHYTHTDTKLISILPFHTHTVSFSVIDVREKSSRQTHTYVWQYSWNVKACRMLRFMWQYVNFNTDWTCFTESSNQLLQSIYCQEDITARLLVLKMWAIL